MAASELDAGSGVRRSNLRDAVEAHRAASQAQAQREDAIAGRRLTVAERFELREQLRRQWGASSGSPRPAETQAAQGIVPQPPPTVTPVADAQPSRLLPASARSQRP
jgi:hypothetical protein